MKRLVLAAALCGLVLPSLAQSLNRPTTGGGVRPSQPSDELTPDQRQAIVAMLTANISQLVQQNLLPAPEAPRPAAEVSFNWPVRQAAGFTDNGYYGVSNYVDHDPSASTARDYNCGARSIANPTGDGHRGTDIFIWPFAWQKVAQNAVEVVAAADGVIIGKTDDAHDHGCTPCPNGCNWNAVYLQHANGSVTWYGHLKKGKLTAKAIGQTVVAGEYLGVVGNSGNSTSPHLHFEVYADNSFTTVVDPWAGACNTTSGGKWAQQEAYRVPTISKILTHATAPVVGTCAADERSNPNLNFSPGGTMYVSAYFRDNVEGTSAIYRIFRPDGSVWSSWTQAFTAANDASWWYYTISLPTSGTYYGIWRYEVTYNGQTASTPFAIGMTLPVELTSFTATVQDGKTALAWRTTVEEGLTGFDVERSSDGNRFEPIGFVPANISTTQTAYTMVDAKPKQGRNYYRLRIRNRNGADDFSKTVSVVIGEKQIVTVGPVPFNNTLTIQLPANSAAATTYQIVNAAGRQMCSGELASLVTENTTGYPSGVYLLMVYEGKNLINRQKLLKL